MGMSFNPNKADTLQGTLTTGIKSVGTSEVIAAAGVSNTADRQTILLINRSNTVTVWVGPTGFSAGDAGVGIAISPRESIRVDITENISLYLRTEASTANVVIWEIG
jgi:hypothetical protein